MCALFGFYDLNNVLPPKIKKKLIRSLSIAAETRGKDATGIAYLGDDELCIFKVGKPAHRVKLFQR
jgi:glucosamine--fructose-6-phosphate aminotransferase (isomerizing)